MSALPADFQAKGLLDRTLIVLDTEFGRKPRANDNDGRDHQDKMFMCLLAGGGVKGGAHSDNSEEPQSRQRS